MKAKILLKYSVRPTMKLGFAEFFDFSTLVSNEGGYDCRLGLAEFFDFSTLSPSYLYVGDGSTNTINQISTGSHTILASHGLTFSIKSIAAGLFADSIVVGTSGGTFLVEELGAGNLRISLAMTGACNALDDIPNDSSFVAIISASVGVLQFYKDPDPENPSAGFVGEVGIEGIFHFIAAGNDWQHAYVLSYIGDNTSRLTSYNYAFPRIDQQVDISGFPLDLKVSGSNVIYVLTYE